MEFDPKALRAARVDHHLSQRALADKADVNRSTVGRLERGEETNPRASTVFRLAQAVDVKTATLFIDE